MQLLEGGGDLSHGPCTIPCATIDGALIGKHVGNDPFWGNSQEVKKSLSGLCPPPNKNAQLFTRFSQLWEHCRASQRVTESPKQAGKSPRCQATAWLWRLCCCCWRLSQITLFLFPWWVMIHQFGRHCLKTAIGLLPRTAWHCSPDWVYPQLVELSLRCFYLFLWVTLRHVSGRQRINPIHCEVDLQKYGDPGWWRWWSSCCLPTGPFRRWLFLSEKCGEVTPDEFKFVCVHRWKRDHNWIQTYINQETRAYFSVWTRICPRTLDWCQLDLDLKMWLCTLWTNVTSCLFPFPLKCKRMQALALE